MFSSVWTGRFSSRHFFVHYLLAACTWAILVGSARAAVPGRGDLVFYELATSGTSSWLCQWFELVNTSGQDLELEQCRLCEGKSDGTDDFTCKSIGADPASVVLGAEFDEDNPALLARDTPSCRMDDKVTVDCVGWNEDGTECTAAPTFTYEGISLSGSYEQLFCLICGGDGSGDCLAPGEGDTIIDEVYVDWDADIKPSCIDRGYEDLGDCAVQSCTTDADANDEVILGDTDLWSLPLEDSSDSTIYYVPETYGQWTKFVPALGTPAAPNECTDFCTPQPGELFFSEVMGEPNPPSDAAEWMEITSAVSDATCDVEGAEPTDRHLNNCVLDIYKDAPDDSGSQWTLGDSYTFTYGDLLTISREESMVIAARQCVFITEEGADSVSDNNFCPRGEFLTNLGSYIMSAPASFRLVLSCPISTGAESVLTEIDSFEYYLDDDDDLDGRSRRLDSGSGAPYDQSNDISDNWCQSSLLYDLIPELSDEAYWAYFADAEDTGSPDACYCNYGTPFTFFDDDPGCPPDIDVRYESEWDYPCRCGTVDSPNAWWPVLLMTWLAVSTARRKKPPIDPDSQQKGSVP